MNLVKQYCTNSGAITSGRKITVKGLMIHSVGTPQPKASVFQSIWNRPDAGACVHAVLEASGTVIQCLPWDSRGWHARLSANNTHIGAEMTEPDTIEYTGGSNWIDKNPAATKAFVLGTYKTAVELFSYLCLLYSLDPLKPGVVISHAEGFKLGVASNHGDPEHIWRKFGLSMDQFRKDIKAEMGKKESGKVSEADEAVKVIQSNLTALGYTPKGGVDGIYGPGTESAVRAFQKATGLTVDGSAGPLTVEKMNELIKEKEKAKAKAAEELRVAVETMKAAVKAAEAKEKAVKEAERIAAEAKEKDELPFGMLLRVCVDTFASRSNAEALQLRLKNAGFESFLTIYEKEVK